MPTDYHDAYAYIRVSDRKQEQGYGHQSQADEVRAYAAANGLRIVELFRETHTGTELWERPELTRLRDLMAAGQAPAHLIIDRVDRFSRNPGHFQIVAVECVRYKVKLHSATENIDETPIGQLITYLKTWKAQDDHATIRRNTMNGIKQRAKAGKPLAGQRALFGYTWGDDKKTYLVEEPASFAVARQMVDWALDGLTLGEMQRRLHAAATPTPSQRGTYWHLSTIRHLLREERYTGVYAVFKTESERASGKRVTHARPADDPARLVLAPDVLRTVDGEPSRLMTADEFAAIGARLARNKAKSVRSAKTPETALLRGGYARCGLCGRKLFVDAPSGGRVLTLYRCQGKRNGGACDGQTISAGDLDAAVWAALEHIIADGDYVARQLAAYDADDPTARDLAAVEAALGKARRELDDMLGTLGRITARAARERIEAFIEQLGQRVAFLEGERDGVLGRRAAWEGARARLANLDAWRATVGPRMAGMDWAAKRRQVLDGLVVLVWVWPDASGPEGRWAFDWEIPGTDGSTAYGTVINAAPQRLRISAATSLPVAA